MTAATAVHSVLKGVQWVLLDFDGPVCDVYAGMPAPSVAAQLRQMLAAAGADYRNRC